MFGFETDLLNAANSMANALERSADQDALFAQMQHMSTMNDAQHNLDRILAESEAADRRLKSALLMYGGR